MIKTIIRILPLVLVTGVALPAAAQGGDDLPPQKRAQVQKRLQQIRDRILRQQVGLDEKKAREVEAVLKRAQKERRKIQRRVRENRRKLRQLLKNDSNDQKAYAAAIRELRKAQNDLHKLKNREFDELAKRLAPKEQAKLVQALQRAKRKMKRAMKRQRRGGGRRGPLD